MGSRGIEVNAPLLYERLGFTQAIKHLAIKELIPELAVKALAVAILPWATRGDVRCLGA